jgi:hypothetical protein
MFGVYDTVIPRKMRHHDEEEYAPQPPPREQKLGFGTDPRTPPPGAGPVQSHRGWRGLQEQTPVDAGGVVPPGVVVVCLPSSPSYNSLSLTLSLSLSLTDTHTHTHTHARYHWPLVHAALHMC